MKVKRIIPGLLAFLITAGTLGGCMGNKKETMVIDLNTEPLSPEVSLTFFGFKYEALNVMAIEHTLHHFMDEYPAITISYDGIKTPEYFEVLEKRLSTGNGNDIFMIDHERVQKFAKQGYLADLSDLSTLDNFSGLAKSQMSVGGTIDYLPTSISAFGLYCNLDLLEEHGQKIPSNLSELKDVCDYFVSTGITPIVANNDISLKTAAIGISLLPIYQQDDPKAALDRLNSSPDQLAQTFRPGFKLVEQMLHKGWVDPSEALETSKTKDDLALFSKGERPFMLTGAWAVPRLRDLNPDLNFEVRPYPILSDGSVLVINVDTRISVNAASPHLDEAKKFVEYLTQSDSMWEFVNSQSSFSPLKENRLAEDQAIQSLGPYLNNGYSVIGSDDNLNCPLWEISRKCVLGMLNGDDADRAVSHMEELIAEWSATN